MTDRPEGAAQQAAAPTLIDWTRAAELRSEVGGDDFDEIVALFLREVQRVLDALPAQASEVPDLADRLHFLKGSSLNLGFARMSALCESGEQAASTGKGDTVDLSALRDCFARSRAEFLDQLAVRLVA